MILSSIALEKCKYSHKLYFAGVNMPDHDVIFSQLATELNNQVTPFVALLRSKDCTGSVDFSYHLLLLVSLFLALEMLLV